MKSTLRLLLVTCFGVGTVCAQVVPTTPTKFSKRITGGGSGSADIGLKAPPKVEPQVRIVSYIALSEARQWTSSDGKATLGKLIAFEDFVTQASSANTQAPPPTLAGKPTLIRDGKVRLLVNQKPFELPLERLSAADREFIEAKRAAIGGSTAR